MVVATARLRRLRAASAERKVTGMTWLALSALLVAKAADGSPDGFHLEADSCVVMASMPSQGRGPETKQVDGFRGSCDVTRREVICTLYAGSDFVTVTFPFSKGTDAGTVMFSADRSNWVVLDEKTKAFSWAQTKVDPTTLATFQKQCLGTFSRR